MLTWWFDFALSLEGVVSVTDYLEHARECAALADRKTGGERKRLLDLAEAWLKLAEQQAEVASIGRGKEPAAMPSPHQRQKDRR